MTKISKAGMLGGIASTLPVSSAQATEMVEPIPGALGMLYDSTLCVGCQACVAECQNVNHTPVNPKVSKLGQITTNSRHLLVT